MPSGRRDLQQRTRRIDDGRPHAVLARLDFGFRQADEIEGGQAVGEMDFDRDERACRADRAQE